MKYAVSHDANRQDGNLAAVHARGCPSTNKDATPEARILEVDGTLRDALDVAVDPEERARGWGDEDVKVYPCAE